jgi:hypothetical protein
MNDDVLSMRFDQYQRYKLVADVLERVRRSGEPLEVLDVGGRTALLRRFLPDRVVLLDLETSPEPGLVLGSGSQMPFQDKAFDVVAAFDTLEHVPVAQRRAFVAECARVARRYVILAGPYEHPRVVEAEQILQRFISEKLGGSVRHLDEHRHHGLPERAEVEQQLAALGGKVVSLPHGNLERWLACQCAAFYMDWHPSLQELSEAFHRFYNRSLYPNDHAEPVYRYVLVAAFDGAPLPDFADLLAPPVTPSGSVALFGELVGELAAFERGRGEGASQVQAHVSGLTKSLEETQKAYRELLDEYQRVLAGLRSLEGVYHSRWASLKRAIGPRRRR